MLFNIFSSMEPTGPMGMNTTASISIPLALIFMAFLAPSFWMRPSQITSTMNTLTSFILHLMPTRKPELLGWDLLLPPMFILLCCLNFAGMIPYTFANTMYPLTSFPFAIILWLAPIIIMGRTNITSLLASLLPPGTPMWLAPFMCLIEVTSLLLRPLTLAFRITANMTAGHLILSLSASLSYALMTATSSLSIMTIIIQSGYTLFEFAVCLLQAAIYCMLLIQYTASH